MISIAKVSNPKYHLEHSQFDYYSEQENEKGEFRGALMKWQKLEGKEVDEKNYMKQINYGGDDNKGVDLCFSPPKDWTILYNLADEDTRLKMDAIRDKAVNSIVKGIEQNTYYRETKDGETTYKLAKGVGMATFNHHTGREVEDEKINPGGYVDCQEHTHITVFPKVLGQDNKYHSHTLYDMKYESGNNHEGLRYLDQLGQYELCKGLQDMGFNVYEIDQHGNFAIEGITDELRNEFSKRKVQIDGAVGENATYNEKKEVSLKFRAGKDSHDLASLREIWQARMKDLGFDKDSLQKFKETKTHTHNDKKLSELIDKDKPLSNKRMKTLALSESKFTDRDFKDKLNEFKQDKNVRSVSKKYNIYADTKAKQKLCNKVDQVKKEKSKLPKSPTKETQKNDKLGVVENIGKSATSIFKGKSSPGADKQPAVSGPKGGQSGSSPQSKEELYSSIKDLEMQLLSFPPIAESSPEVNQQRAMIEEQIGQLKQQLKKTEEHEQQANTSAHSATSSAGLDSDQSSSLPKAPKTPEEKEDELIEEKANKIVDLTNNEDIMTDSSSSKKLSSIQKEFDQDHKTIVNELVQGQTAQHTISR